MMQLVWTISRIFRFLNSSGALILESMVGEYVAASYLDQHPILATLEKTIYPHAHPHDFPLQWRECYGYVLGKGFKEFTETLRDQRISNDFKESCFMQFLDLKLYGSQWDCMIFFIGSSARKRVFVQLQWHACLYWHEWICAHNFDFDVILLPLWEWEISFSTMEVKRLLNLVGSLLCCCDPSKDQWFNCQIKAHYFTKLGCFLYNIVCDKM